jgi:hypothetical protein
VLPPIAAVDIAAAHVFGLFRNLHLRENARSIALSVRARVEVTSPGVADSSREQLISISKQADAEIRDRATADVEGGNGAVVRIETGFGAIRFNIAEPVIHFARKLAFAENSEEALGVLREADLQLDHWAHVRRKEPTERRIVFPFGLEVEIPESFEAR